MSGEHYFSEQPVGEFKTKTIFTSINGERVELFTAGSTFSPDHMDTGTAILLEHSENAPNSGHLLDLGCGWGPIALSLAAARPEATVWAVDVNERALELTRMNAEKLGLSNIRTVLPAEVPNDIRFSGIWSNPPIRVGKAELHAILETWIPRLNPGGEAWLVVAKSLGAESLQKWLGERWPGAQVSTATIAKGFRVIAFVAASA